MKWRIWWRGIMCAFWGATFLYKTQATRLDLELLLKLFDYLCTWIQTVYTKQLLVPDDKRFVCIPHAQCHSVTGLISSQPGIRCGVSQQTSIQRSIQCALPAVCGTEVKGVIRSWHLRRLILFSNGHDCFTPEVIGDWYLISISCVA